MTFRISGSDIKSLHKCEFRWYYERYRNLMPIEGWSAPMMLGTKGHDIMEAAFKALQATGRIQDAHQAAGEVLAAKYLSDVDVLKVFNNITQFINWVGEQGWEIVAVEDTLYQEMTADNEFAFTPDLVVRITRGPLKNQLVIVDFKFTGQYWVDREINTHQQVPRYIIYYNHVHGTNIKRGLIVMVNTRAREGATGTQLFLPKWIEPKPERMKNLERETRVMIDRIHMLTEFGRLVGDHALREILVHTSDEKTCKMCIFADDLCPMEFDGRDTTKVLKFNYKLNNTYGYNGEQDGAGQSDSGND